ncbi:MAG: D-alanine--D-alanine ligase, partial [Spirochaetaceae bacterium]
MKIALVYGGRSGEHSVSCVSATSILRAIDPNKYTVILIGIDHDGCWYRQNTPSTKELENSDFILSVNAPGSGQIAFIPGKGITINSQSIEIDAAFPILHGTFGEDGTIQGLFEMLNIPYVGSGVVGSSVGMDKHLAKELWQSAGINVVPYRVLFKHE